MDLLYIPAGRVCGEVPAPRDVSADLGERIADHPVLYARLQQSIDRMLDEVWDVELLHERIDALTTLLDESDHDGSAFEDQLDDHLESVEVLKDHVRDVEEVWRGSEATCGDGVRSGNELCASRCDDGNQDDGDGCNSECMVEYCGDGIIQSYLGEICEDDDPYCRKRCRVLYD